MRELFCRTIFYISFSTRDISSKNMPINVINNLKKNVTAKNFIYFNSLTLDFLLYNKSSKIYNNYKNFRD